MYWESLDSLIVFRENHNLHVFAGERHQYHTNNLNIIGSRFQVQYGCYVFGYTLHPFDLRHQNSNSSFSFNKRLLVVVRINFQNASGIFGDYVLILVGLPEFGYYRKA